MAARKAPVASEAGALVRALEAISGVRRAWQDDTGSVWVVVQTAAERDRVRAEAARVAEKFPDDPPTEFILATVADDAELFRARFEGITRNVSRSGSVTFRVQLSWGGQSVETESGGDGGEPVELRTVAAATVAGLEKLIGESLELRLLGAKRVRVFDADLVVVSFLRNTAPRHLVGAVTVPADVYHAGALAVLDALNRFIGTRLATRE